MNLLHAIGIKHPIIQAPMAGISTPALAAAVSNAGGLDSLGIGAADVATARQMIEDVRSQTNQPFNINVFTHQPAQAKPEAEAAWLHAMAPLFAAYGAAPPASLREIYKSFSHDEPMQDMLVACAPHVVSFHFGLPPAQVIGRLKQAGCLLLSTATNLDEAHQAVAAGIDAIVAQGYEAGGHRGLFDPSAHDDQLRTMPLTKMLVDTLAVPVIAAGGIMNGSDIKAYLAVGAAAVQMGTAFIGCPESSADEYYRQALASAKDDATVMTRAISGRPARCLRNRFTAWGQTQPDHLIPDYPIAYDAGKALNAAAKAKGEGGYGAQWAGTGAAAARCLPVAAFMQALMAEMDEAG